MSQNSTTSASALSTPLEALKALLDCWDGRYLKLNGGPAENFHTRELFEQAREVYTKATVANLAPDYRPLEPLSEERARLIAAAPKLLEALQSLLSRYRVLRPQIAGTDQWEEDARAAIACVHCGADGDA